MPQSRAKFGYLNYEDMLTKISNGVLDIHDIIYTRDTHEIYIVSPDLIPIAMKSRVYIFDSVDNANSQLNINTDTYKGQIVSVLNNDKYIAYIVNQDENGIYFIAPLSNDNIDYNTIGNRPIDNLFGTLDAPIIIDTLIAGMYKIKGQYKISQIEETIYLSEHGDLFLIETTDTEKYIKHFANDFICDFIINNSRIIKKTYITDEYLTNNGYTTIDYVDEKITTFERYIRSDIETYVQQTIENIIAVKADKSTTIAGYGITNAYTKTEVDSAINSLVNGQVAINKDNIETLQALIGNGMRPISKSEISELFHVKRQ